MLFFILIPIFRTQSTVLIEQPIIQPYSYLQLGQVIGDVQKQKFKVGQLNVNQTFYVGDNDTVSVVQFLYNDTQYACLIQQFQYPNKTQDPTRCGITYVESDLNYIDNCTCQLQTNKTSSIYKNCCQINLKYFDQEIKGNDLQQVIIVLLNLGEKVIKLNTTYSIIIDNQISFYQISLILCLGFGVVVVIAVSLLCILNVKYQELKQTNIKLKLTNRTDDYLKPKLL